MSHNNVGYERRHDRPPSRHTVQALYRDLSFSSNPGLFPEVNSDSVFEGKKLPLVLYYCTIH